MKHAKLLINGQWVESSSGERYELRNPANLDEVVGTLAKGTAEDTRQAIEAARAALPGWGNMPPPQRGVILDKAAQILTARLDEIAATLTREEGKTLAEARGEVARARDILRYFAGEGWRLGGEVYPSNASGELLYSRREPLGVVAIITPWNFPIAIPAWKIAPALAYGNTIVFKPARHGDLTALAFVEALVEGGLPAGVLNYITGPGSVIGDELVASPQINGVSFTGSYYVGTRIYEKAMKNLTRVQLEMGGKNPTVILDDADLPLAVELVARSAFGLTGQAYTATSRVIVQDGIADRFAKAISETARKWVVGNGLESTTMMGPAVSDDQLKTDLDYVQVGQSEGAQLIAGGSRASGGAAGGGYFVEPTVFDGVLPEMRIAQEEIFGPVIGLIRVHTLEEAIEKANGIGFGLAAAVVTNDLKKAFTFANAIDAGVVKINEPTTGLALQAPFGGFKHSSANTFKEQGPAAIEFYTRVKTIYVGHG
ncbi:MAG: aldehyde dehydrogenase family protein [Anaerolineaceae bacterium]|nr:aldehyde dehydrogenase family protein [Anaerolineaceae bacterium]